jgi:hypothetical protein
MKRVRRKKRYKRTCHLVGHTDGLYSLLVAERIRQSWGHPRGFFVGPIDTSPNPWWQTR